MCEEYEKTSKALINNPKNIKDILRTGLNLLALDNPKNYKIEGCVNCGSCHHETDGDYGEIDCGYTCDKFEHFSYLKSFPFNKVIPCFQIGDWQGGNSSYFWFAYLIEFFDWDFINQGHIPKLSWFSEDLMSKVFQWYLKKERKKQGEKVWACQANCRCCSFKNENCLSRSLKEKSNQPDLFSRKE